MATLANILGADALEQFEAQAEIRHGLPAAAYTSGAVQRLENERLFPESWVFVGLAHEMPNPGDVVPVTVAGQPILLVRGHGGEITAFHNVCRHRGTTLVAEACHVDQVLTCPYHAWAYGLDGRLRATPHFDGYGSHTPSAFDPTNFGLVSVRSFQWHDWLFVNLDGKAMPFEQYVTPLEQRLRDIEFDKVTPLATLDFGTVNANWKLLMENFMEPYHVAFVHPKTAQGQPLRDHYTVVDGACLGCAVDVVTDEEGVGTAARASEALDMSARYLTLFPNFVLGVYVPDQLGVHLNTPLDAGQTHQRRVIYHVGRDTPSADSVESLSELWRNVHLEDHAIVERLQEGRASDVMESGGLLSPHWEDGVRRFQELVLEAIR